MTSSNASGINLKGSVDIVTEFFDYGFNSILYQRGLYPADEFEQVQKYGLSLLMNRDERLRKYINKILAQLKDFLTNRVVRRVVLVIINTDSKEPLERWEFNVKCDKTAPATDLSSTKELKDIQNGIRDVIRQITACVSFLPLLDGNFAFDVLLHTDKDTPLPGSEWADSAPYAISDAQPVQLRNFSTGIHMVDAAVAYKNVQFE